MQVKSLNELVLEMIHNCNKFSTPRIQNSRNAKRYTNTMDFVYGLLNYHQDNTFEDLQNAMDYVRWSSSCIEPTSKYERKYFDLAIEHCQDIVDSVDLRFVSGYEKQ